MIASGVVLPTSTFSKVISLRKAYLHQLKVYKVDRNSFSEHNKNAFKKIKQ